MDESKESMCLSILDAHAVDIRDVDNGQEPFLYASGHKGPGYLSIKNLVGRKGIIKPLVHGVAAKVAEEFANVDFVAGNVTGGIVPGWILSENLSGLLKKNIPFVYIREARKKGGQKELITGMTNNPEISDSMNALVVEELVNFAQTTCNSAEILRDSGYKVTHAATILFYNNPEAIKALKKHNIEMISLLTLPEVLQVAEKHNTHSKNAINSYREFLKDPLKWEAERGFVPLEEGGTI